MILRVSEVLSFTDSTENVFVNRGGSGCIAMSLNLMMMCCVIELSRDKYLCDNKKWPITVPLVGWGRGNDTMKE